MECSQLMGSIKIKNRKDHDRTQADCKNILILRVKKQRPKFDKITLTTEQVSGPSNVKFI